MKDARFLKSINYGSTESGRKSLKITLVARSRKEANLCSCVDVNLGFKIP
jgi:hypothetical protein